MAHGVNNFKIVYSYNKNRLLAKTGLKGFRRLVVSCEIIKMYRHDTMKSNLDNCNN
jgi:hypothetical protein